jgi:hypothetical protein
MPERRRLRVSEGRGTDPPKADWSGQNERPGEMARAAPNRARVPAAARISRASAATKRNVVHGGADARATAATNRFVTAAALA